jgi:hypothetical protein
MLRSFTAAALVMVVAAPVFAQTTPQQGEQAASQPAPAVPSAQQSQPAAPATEAAAVAPAPAPAPAPASYILKQGTQIRFTVVSPVNSKEHRVGKRIEMQVADNIIVNDKIVLAKGTPAFGELTLSSPSGAFGKSGKMAGRLLYIQNGKENIPVTGNFDDRGASGTTATVAVAIVAGVFSAFVKGKNAVLEAGTEIIGNIERDVKF